MSLLFLNEDELRQTINFPDAHAVLDAAFKASSGNLASDHGGFILSLSEVKGAVEVKGTYTREAPYYVVKIDNDFEDNPKINLPVSSGLTAIFDAATGFPAAILLDSGYLTRVRAGVVGTMAVEYLANAHAKTIAIIGTGRQAYVQLKSLLTTRHFESIMVWGRTPLKADAYIQRILEDNDANLVIAPTVEAAVRDADIVITTTPSQQPLIKAGWLKPGVHINAVGSRTPPKQELAVDVLQRADVIVVDSLRRAASQGEVHHGLISGRIDIEKIQGELGDLVRGKISGRTSPEQITLADLTGLQWQDAVIAIMALEKATFLGLGQRLDLGLLQRHQSFRIENLS